MLDLHNSLYRPEFEKENCGFGLIAHMDDKASHFLVDTAITALARMTHRGGINADGKTGDGCGLLIKKPDAFLRAVATETGFELAAIYSAANLFLNPDKELAEFSKRTLAEKLEAEGLEVVGYRELPVNTEVLGEIAMRTLPGFTQLFVNAPEGMDEADFQRKLFLARRRAELVIRPNDKMFYVPALSSQVISYKGLMLPVDLPNFYLDLRDERLESSIAVFHQRFSTNTAPQWPLAQPFRYLAHNGEINTIRGNRNWAMARASRFQAPGLPSDMNELGPLVNQSGSDSSSLDNMLEVLLAGGLDIFQAMRLLVPPAWQNVDDIDPDLRAFYEYHYMHMEPWDGPAGIVLTDGRYASCTLDRNGLRPARWVMTKDRHMTLASEIGVWDYKPEDVVAKGRLRPGQMIAVDTSNGELKLPDDIDAELAARHPYKAWLRDNVIRLAGTLADTEVVAKPLDAKQLQCLQKLFNVSFEERDQVLRPLADAGQEATGSMGDDTPFPVLSTKIRSIFDNFRQQFAQVTNPPIDPLREAIVMSLKTHLGVESNLFKPTAEAATRIVLDSPVLSEKKFYGLLGTNDSRFNHCVISLHYDESSDLQTAIASICQQAIDAVNNGDVLLVLSDRGAQKGKLPVHAMLATGAVHHALNKAGLRCSANLIIETATARDSHHFACLIGYGATAIYPYLSYEILHDMTRTGELPGDEHSKTQLARSYRKGINKGLYKILSKMGISTVASYRGAQLFEIVGLHEEVVDLCFLASISRIQGANFDDLESDQRALAADAWDHRKELDQGGILKYVHGGEYHAYNPDVIQTLHRAVQDTDYEAYKEYARLVNDRPASVLRDMFKINDATAISIDDVEPIEDIIKRFDSAGMSLGALSPEAHEALAIAMNRLGGRSNSGEGGEDPKRFGTEKMSKIKQIASGRFGVTPHYLVNAEVLQIKVAQGAKPGEGGQLPGHKVNDMIATLRHSVPGVALISPPPHHDIYSIEDLAQLIYDLKQVNPDALVSVKLVSEPGVGTIAAGVAKAYADLITISGYDGGTGASPLTSVRYAGSPWELGLSETHQVLRANDLRDKVRVQTDGGLKTGVDVIKAAILGAESFGFGTGPMVALGCKYLRICHLNNCATGVATQNNVLRMRHFIGLPEMVMNYFKFIAEETRELMASIGVRSLEELIGRTDLLSIAEGKTDRQNRLDLTPILSDAGLIGKPQFCVAPQNDPYDKGILAEQMVQEVLPAIEGLTGGDYEFVVDNECRSIGARISGEIAKRHGNYGMKDAPLNIKLTGTAGQSFGVWNAAGLNMTLEGDSNDYVGKGMAGGKLVVYPPKGSAFKSNETSIIGNTCLYGATGGKLFAAGTAGERFAVRNSGATAVVEGVGDHGCEYMTSGVVAVLGPAGLNFGAGMTGGFAFVLDQDRRFVDRYNHELIDINRLTAESMEAHATYLRSLIEEHVAETGSEWAKKILHDFRDYLPRFWLVKPKASELSSLMNTLRRAA